MSGNEENARGGFKETGRLEVVFLATAWGPTHGGINAFNMDFACALGRILKKGRVGCVVLDASDADVQSAGAAGVKLLQVRPRRYHSAAFEARRADDVLTRLKDAGIDPAAVTWWVGHDAHTGELANEMPKVSKAGKSVVIHHMSYEDYQAFMHGDAQKAQRKADLQREIFRSADRAFAVGPLLLGSLKQMLEPLKKHGSARMIVPGLAQIEPCRESFDTFQAITFGRMSRETDRIKQVRLAIESFADACSVKKYPDAVPKLLQRQPRLHVYGIDQAEQSQQRERAARRADRVLPFMPLPYSDRDSIFQQLRQMDVAMMLSWHEGFGLVGWEAISAEVPLIVTRNSGLYQLVEGELGDDGVALLLGVDIEAAEDPSGEHNFSPADLENTRKAIWKCAKDRQRAKRNANALLQMLREKDYTWESAARKFAEDLGLRVSLRAASVGEVASPVGVATGRGLPRMGHGSELSMMDARALLETSIGSDAYLAAEAAIEIEKRGADETKRAFDADWQKAPEHATTENFLRDVFYAFGENFAHHLFDILEKGARSAVDVAIYAFPRAKDPKGRLYSWANCQVNRNLGDFGTMVLPMIAIGSAGLAAYALDVIKRANRERDGIVGETLVRLFVQADSRDDANWVLEAMCKFIQDAHAQRWPNPGLLLTGLPTWLLTSAAVDSLVERGLANQLPEIRSFASDAIMRGAGTRRVVSELIQRHAVSGSWDNTLRLWDLATGETKRTFQGHTHWVTAVAAAPDGRHLVSGSGDNTLRVWDLATGKTIVTLRGHTEWVTAVALTPDSRHLVSGSGDNTLRVWDLVTGEVRRTFEGHTASVEAVAVTADGRHVISGSLDHTLRVWNLESGETERTLKGHSELVTAVALTPDDRYVVSGSNDSSLRVWNLITGKTIRTFQGHSLGVNAVAVTPNGRHVVSGSSDNTLRVWDLETGENKSVFHGHTGSVTAVAVTPDGCRAVSGSWDQRLRVWNLTTQERKRIELQANTERVTAVATTPNDHHVISGFVDNALRVRDLATGETIRTLRGHTEWVVALAVTFDGRRVVSGSWDHTLRVWNLASGETERVLQGHTKRVTAVAITFDGRHVVSGSGDNTLRVWNLASGETQRVLQGHTQGVTAVSITPDGCHIVSGSRDYTLRVWNLVTGETERVLQGHTDSVTSVAVTPDGRRVVSGSGDHTLRVWNLANGETERTLKGHIAEVTALAVTPAGHHVVSGSKDYTLRVWNWKDERELVTCTVDGVLGTCIVACGGRTIVARDGFGRVHFLQLEGLD